MIISYFHDQNIKRQASILGTLGLPKPADILWEHSGSLQRGACVWWRTGISYHHWGIESCQQTQGESLGETISPAKPSVETQETVVPESPSKLLLDFRFQIVLLNWSDLGYLLHSNSKLIESLSNWFSMKGSGYLLKLPVFWLLLREKTYIISFLLLLLSFTFFLHQLPQKMTTF